jgi:NADH-quinone oxidoreductase subunit E
MKTEQATLVSSTCVHASEKTLENQTNEILKSFKGEKSEIIPILQQVQQKFGYLPEAAMKQIADFVHVPASTVFGIGTFYAQFKLVPTGRNVIKICRGTGCYVRGAPRIISEMENKLGIKDGGTTSDLEYSLETVACFGSCALAPVIVVNDKVHGRMTPDKAKKLIEKE